jgi:predicted ribosome quality control (RQC) complex YloA/Tae2 family protein
VNDQTIKAIVEEIAPVLTGRTMGKIFQLSRLALAIDFRPGDGRYLFISVEPSRPGIYMIERRVRDLEKQSLAQSPFVQVLRKHLGSARLISLTKDEDDRIVRFAFKAHNEVGHLYERNLVAQLTGKAANLLLLDERGFIIDTLRPPRGEGQETGERYQPPPPNVNSLPATEPLERGQSSTLSEAVDNYYLQLETRRAFELRAATARARLRKEIAQREKLQRHLDNDLKAHGNAVEHKRIGDLLITNIGTAERRGKIVKLTDYYADDTPLIELEVDENSTLQEEAARRFSRYTKARRASQEIALRMNSIEKELETLRVHQTELERIIASGDDAALEDFTGVAKTEGGRKGARKKSVAAVPGARRYRSSDGYEILVGRAARDNDQLTFRVARPHDLWLHAADYPGSHVIIRNPTRADIPHRTIIEAAQLAAAFSQAKRDAKVDVHYTQRKFLSKPKGAAPGLVRMSSFRTITVEPSVCTERI